MPILSTGTRSKFLHTLFFIILAALAAGNCPVEAAGPTIRDIRIEHGPLFDPVDPVYGHFPYTWMEWLHIDTRDWVVRNTILLRSGDTLDTLLWRDSARALRRLGFLNCDTILVLPADSGRVDLVAKVEDNWSLRMGTMVRHDAGFWEYGAAASDRNTFGTGVELGTKAYYLNRQLQVDLYTGVPNVAGTAIGFEIGTRWMEDGRKFWLNLHHDRLSERDRLDWGISVLEYRNHELPLNDSTFSPYAVTQSRKQLTLGWHPSGPVGGHVILGALSERVQADPDDPDRTVARLGDDLRAGGLALVWREADWATVERVQQALHKEDLAIGHQFGLALAPGTGNMAAVADPLWMHLYEESAWFWRPVYLSFLFRAYGFVHGEEYTGTGIALVHGFWQPEDRFTLAWQAKFAQQSSAGVARIPLSLGEHNGLRGIRADGITGDRYLLVNVEARWTSPWIVLTTNPGLALFADMASVRTPTGMENAANLGIGLRVGHTRSSSSRISRFDLAIPLTPNASWRFQLSSSLPFQSYTRLDLIAPVPSEGAPLEP